MATAVEIAAMRRALELSAARLGTSNPNPTVGAVVLDVSGKVVGEGVTQPVGGDHAEVVALQAAGDRARGGVIVVTLEPCAHTGRSQRCTEVIQGAGVARVVYGLSDPNPVAAGGGEQLVAVGVDVESGVLAAEAALVLGPWVAAAGRDRAHLTWKYAATLDGRTAAADGSSQWITGELARADVHRLRAEADAVLVGIGTVLADDPQLTARDWPASRQPLRVVVDSDGRTPLDSRVLDKSATTLIAVCDDAPDDRIDALRQAGVEVAVLERSNGHADLAELLTLLRQRDVFVAFLEGGATLAASFLRSGLVDRLIGYYAPALLGSGPAALGDIGIESIGESLRLTTIDVTRLGEDIRITAVPASDNQPNGRN
jgi:diaminohydroxyphosphoribosylaminopyrimidine deaminase/5-amino-6-(5-phosphoribosylamino)uracil reductase